MKNPWDERYGQEEYYYGTEPNDFLREKASLLKKGSQVLCLAEGEGRNAVYLAGQGHEVTAVDGSREGLKKLEKLAKAKGVKVHTVVADLADFEIRPSEWDAIVSIWCHLPRELRRSVHRKCVEGLRPGGLFLLEAYIPRQLEYKTGGPPTAELMMGLEDLRTELAGLEFLHGEEKDRMISEGRGHSGKSAVVQVAARK